MHDQSIFVDVLTFPSDINKYLVGDAIYDNLVPQVRSLERQDHLVFCHSLYATSRLPEVDKHISKLLEDVTKTILYVNRGEGSQVETLQEMMGTK